MPERVLAVVAHPDDVDFGSAGTIASGPAGVKVAYCIVTTGTPAASTGTPRGTKMAALRESSSGRRPRRSA